MRTSIPKNFFYDAEKIRENFDTIATKYDRFNDWITLRIHRYWKKKVVQKTLLPKGSSFHVLDLCCGSGDLSLRLALHLGVKSTVTAVDFSEKMLSVLKSRLKRAQKPHADVQIYQQDAVSLQNFASCSFAGVVLSFGLRNITDREACLKETLRVLQPEGNLIVLDVGKVRFRLIDLLFRFYFERVVPQIGKILHPEGYLMYSYLPASAERYPDQKGIQIELQKAGFARVSYENFMFGSAVIHTAQKVKT